MIPQQANPLGPSTNLKYKKDFNILCQLPVCWSKFRFVYWHQSFFPFAMLWCVVITSITPYFHMGRSTWN
jgi:hypothetical protein